MHVCTLVLLLVVRKRLWRCSRLPLLLAGGERGCLVAARAEFAAAMAACADPGRGGTGCSPPRCCS